MRQILDSLGAAFVRVSPYGPIPPSFAAHLVDAWGGWIDDEGHAWPGAPALSPEGIAWVHARLERYGVHSDAQNYGGLRCCACHVHGSDGECLAVDTPQGIVYLRRYRDPREGVSRLLRVAHHATLGGDVAGLPAAAEGGLEGYRSTVPKVTAQKLPDPDDDGSGDSVAGVFDAINPFAPSAELEKRIQETAATWAGLEAKMAADPKLAKVLKASHDHWLEFWKKWQAGDRDQSDANAVIIDANASRANALGILTQNDPNRIKTVALEDQSAAKGAAVKVDDAAAAAGVQPGGEWKIPAAIGGGVLVVLLAVLGRR